MINFIAKYYRIAGHISDFNVIKIDVLTIFNIIITLNIIYINENKDNLTSFFHAKILLLRIPLC